MKSFIIFVMLLTTSLYAKGVSAGTIIENSATLSFSMDEDDYTIESNIVRDVVHQLIDVEVSWMDTRAVIVSKGDKERVLTFKVINSGNGVDIFDLASEQAGGHSDFEAKRRKIYIDSNDNLRLDKDDKMVSTVALEEDELALVFVSSDIAEDISAISGSRSFVALQATSQRGGSSKRGTLHKNEGIGGIDAIDGIGGGVSVKSGIYKLFSANVQIKKSVLGGGKEVEIFNTSSVLTVKIDVSITGEGKINNLTVRDEVPQEVEYLTNTLRLDGRSLTDVKDEDKGRCIRDDITVHFDTLSASSNHTITYKVKVKKD